MRVRVWLGLGLGLRFTIARAYVHVWQEHQVRATDAREYLASLGLYGAIVSGVQCVALERPALQRAAEAARQACLP